MNKNQIFSLAIFLTLSTSSFSNESNREPQSRFPEDIDQALKLLPEQALTLPFILTQAMEFADSFKAITGSIPGTAVPRLIALSPLDVYLSGKFAVTNDDKEIASGSSINPGKTRIYQLGLSKLFPTGSNVYTKLYATDSSYNLIALNRDIDSAESTLTFGIEQSLWKDSLGFATRKKIKAGELESSAALDRVIEEGENWSLAIAESYYLAWLSKEKVLAAREKLNRQNKLAKITKLRVNRGSSSAADLLQIESSAILSQTQAATSENELQKIWRLLISTVKLPNHWMKIDATTIPLKVEQLEDSTIQYCANFEEAAINKNNGAELPNLKENPKVVRFQKEAEAKRLQHQASQWDFWPDLKVFAEYGANGIEQYDNLLNRQPDDKNRTRGSISEAADLKHTFWTVGLSMNVALGFRANRAQVYKSASDRFRAIALADGAMSAQQLEILSACANLNKLAQNDRLFRRSLGKQKERAALEESRFQSGRTPIFNAIQASNDLTDAQLINSQNTAELRIAVWKLKQLKGDLYNTLKEKLDSYE